MKTNSSVVVVPIYKEIPSETDLISLEQCFKIFRNQLIIFVMPNGLVLKNYPYKHGAIEEFDKQFFEDITGYNRLMLSPEFYKRFSKYEYILIYQTDAFVFEDRLAHWVSRGWDYIGAPWLYPYVDFFKNAKENIKSWIHWKYNITSKDEGNIPTANQFRNRVGNGGFSLRKVNAFFHLCMTQQEIIEKYLKRHEKEFNEDVFWSIEVNRKRQNLSIPNYKEALKFSVESCPKDAFHLLKNQLPFGCHGWDKQKDFWRPIFKELDYII